MRNFSRGIKTILILVLVVISLAFISGQVIKGVLDYESTESVLVFKSDIQKGTILKDNNFFKYVKEINISASAIPSTALQSMHEIKRVFISENVYEGEFITANSLSEESPFHIRYDIPEGYSLISLRFDKPDSANAWNIFVEQEISLVYSPSNSTKDKYSEERIIDAVVYSIKDSQLFVDGELEYNPSKLLYVTFLVTEDEAVYLARVKDKGRLEVIQ
jgi:hypothetical protein